MANNCAAGPLPRPRVDSGEYLPDIAGFNFLVAEPRQSSMVNHNLRMADRDAGTPIFVRRRVGVEPQTVWASPGLPRLRASADKNSVDNSDVFQDDNEKILARSPMPMNFQANSQALGCATA